MTKTSKTPEVTAVEQTLAQTDTPAVAHTDQWTRQTAVQYAIDHHRINGGMLTVPQLIDNAKQFHAYITGETK
jgi:hypothetical protein